MTIKKTNLLRDDPSDEDEFGPHTRVATLVKDEIASTDEGRSIAVIGEWGSGKSTVIKLLEAQLKKLISLSDSKVDARVFTYDAWSHQGDPLRRSFLDDLIAFLKAEKLISADQADTAVHRVWNRQELTTTTTEPVARKHALLLLLSLALVPLGMKILEFPSGLTSNFLCAFLSFRDLFAMALIIAPIPLIAMFGLINWVGPQWLRRFLFGVTSENKHFSVLSFFFEKTEGKVERKLIKTPSDSIIEFKFIFADLMNAVSDAHKNLRFVIIIDNIDRIPPDHAKDFWSTMQTFFGDDGGARKKRSRRYWLVAPFSLNALSFIFRDAFDNSKESDAEFQAKAYVDKTFGIAVNVPPPILANWRKYLLEQLQKAFPDHAYEDLATVRDLYGIAIGQAELITPRALKLFINGLVVLYRQREGEISLPLAASFLMHRSSIAKQGVSPELLKPQEQAILDVENWRAMFAALYYGVTPEEGNQILLQEPIQNAFVASDISQLKLLEVNPGFIDVLLVVIRANLEAAKNAAMLAQISATLSELKAAGEKALFTVWRQLAGRIKANSDWLKFQQPVASGLKAVIDHSSDEDRKLFVTRMVESISSAEAGEPDENLSAPSKLVENWLDAAATLLKAATALPEIRIPGSPRFKLEALQQLAESKLSASEKLAIKVDDPKQIADALSAEISVKRYLRAPEKFVTLIAYTQKLPLPWSPIVTASATRLRQSDVSQQEIMPLIVLLVSIGTIANINDAFSTLKELSKEGILSNFFHHQVKNKAISSAIILSSLLSNPTFERPTQANQSGDGDNKYQEFIKKPESDKELIQAVAELTVSTRAITKLYEIAAKNANVAKACAVIISAISATTSDLDIDAKFLVDNRKFLEDHVNLISPGAFIFRLVSRDKIIELLRSEPFETAKSSLYRAALSVAVQTRETSYIEFLENGVQTRPEDEWGKALNATSGPEYELVLLAKELRVNRPGFFLSTTARDALLEQIRKVGEGAISATSEVKSAFADVRDLIQVNQQHTLARDVVEDLIASGDSQKLLRIIDFYGDNISRSALAEQPADRIVLRILNPALSAPDEKSVQWIAKILRDDKSIFEAASMEAREDFAVRLRDACKATLDNVETRKAIDQIATDLGIDLTIILDEDEKPKEAEDKS